MYSKICVGRNTPGELFDQVRHRLSQSEKGEIVYGDLIVSYYGDDLCFAYGQRLLETPEVFKGHVKYVMIDYRDYGLVGHPEWSTYVDKTVKWTNASATMQSGGGKTAFLFVKGNNLAAANRLYQAILDGSVNWR